MGKNAVEYMRNLCYNTEKGFGGCLCWNATGGLL